MTRLSETIGETIAEVRPASNAIREQARQRLESLAMPRWALGRLLDLAESLSAMAGTIEPAFDRTARFARPPGPRATALISMMPS